MLWKQIISSFLFVLLVVFCCNNLPCEVYSTYGNSLYSVTALTSGKSQCNSHQGIYLGKPSKKTDHVKVKYMGGEGSADCFAWLDWCPPPAYVDKCPLVRPDYLVCACTAYRFHLRGPPAPFPPTNDDAIS